MASLSLPLLKCSSLHGQSSPDTPRPTWTHIYAPLLLTLTPSNPSLTLTLNRPLDPPTHPYTTIILSPHRAITSILSSDTRLAFRLTSHLTPIDVGRSNEGRTEREGERWQFKFESERDLQSVMHALRPFLPPSPSPSTLTTQPPSQPQTPSQLHYTHPTTQHPPPPSTAHPTVHPTHPNIDQTQTQYLPQGQTQFLPPEQGQCRPPSAWDPPPSSGYLSHAGRSVQHGHGQIDCQSPAVGQSGRYSCAADGLSSGELNGLSHTQRYETQGQVQGMQSGGVGSCVRPGGLDSQLTQSNSGIQPVHSSAYQPLPVQPSVRAEAGHGGARAHPGLPQVSFHLSQPWTPPKSDGGHARLGSKVSPPVPLRSQERVSEGAAYRQGEGPTTATSHQSSQRHSTVALKRDVLDMLREYDHDVRLRSRLQSILQAIEAQPVQKVLSGPGSDVVPTSATTSGAGAGCSHMLEGALPSVAKPAKVVRRPIRTAKKLSCRQRTLIRPASPIKQRIAQTERKLLTRLSVLEKEIQKIDQTILLISSQDHLANTIASAFKVMFKSGSEAQACAGKSLSSAEQTAPIRRQISACAYDDVDALAESTRRASLSSPPIPNVLAQSDSELRRDQTRNDSGPVVNVLADVSRLPVSIVPSTLIKRISAQAQSHHQHATGLSIPKVKLRRIKLVQSHKYTNPQLQSNGKILVANPSFVRRNSITVQASSPTRKRRCLITDDDMGVASEPDGG